MAKVIVRGVPIETDGLDEGQKALVQQAVDEEARTASQLPSLLNKPPVNKFDALMAQQIPEKKPGEKDFSDFLEENPWTARMMGATAGLGATALTGGGLGAAALATLLGGALRPRSVGDLAMTALAPGVGKVVGQGAKLIPGVSELGPLGKTLMAGGEGLAANEAFNALGEGTNRLANAAGLQHAPQGPMIQNPMDNPLATAISMGLPMAGQAVRNRINASGPSVSTKIWNAMTGGTANPSELGPESQLVDARRAQPGLSKVQEPIDLGKKATIKVQDKIDQLNQDILGQVEDRTKIDKSIQEKAVQKAQLSQQQTAVQSQAEQAARQAQMEQAQAQQAIGEQQAQVKAQQQQQADIKSKAAEANLELQKEQADNLAKAGADTPNWQFTPQHVTNNTNMQLDVLTLENQLEQAKQLKAPQQVIDGLKTTIEQKKVDILRNKAEGYAAQDQFSKNNEDLEDRLAGVTSDQQQAKLDKAQLDLETASKNTARGRLEQNLRDIQKNVDAAYAPGVRDFVQKADGNASNLVSNVLDPKTAPEVISAYRQHLENLTNGQQHVNDLKNAVVKEFFRRAYDPTTKSFSNAPGLFTKNFPADKINALYGSNDAANQFESAVSDIAKANELTTGRGMLKDIGRHLLMYALPGTLLFHGGLEKAAMVGAAAGALSVPTLIDHMMKNPTFADSFHRWANSSAPERSLANWPRLAAYMKNNGVSADELSNAYDGK